MRTTKALEHLSVSEIDEKIKTTVGYWRVRRWMIIRHAMIEPSSAEKIAKIFGVKKQSVSNLVSQYNRHGIKAVEVKGRGQRQKANLKLEEEKAFLEKFITKAQDGQLSTVKEVHKALEKKLGKKIHVSTVYRMLHRHQWRKIKPRPTHVKSDPKAREDFKKTSQNKSKNLSKPVPRKTKGK